MADLAPFVRTDFKAVDKHDALHSVKSWVTGDSAKLPIVTDDEKAFGIVNERALMGRHMDLNAHVHQFTLATRALPTTASVEQARERMAEFRAAYLPVEDKRGKLVGFVSALDLALSLGVNGQKAADLAVPVTMLREEDTIGEALHAFAKEYVEFLPVLRKDGRLAGVLSRGAILKVEFNNGDKGRKDAGGEKIRILNDPVGGFIDSAPAVVPANADFATLAATIEDHGYAIVGTLEQPRGIATAETLFRRASR